MYVNINIYIYIYISTPNFQVLNTFSFLSRSLMELPPRLKPGVPKVGVSSSQKKRLKSNADNAARCKAIKSLGRTAYKMIERDGAAEFASSFFIGVKRQNQKTKKTILKIIGEGDFCEEVMSALSKDGFKMGCIDKYSKTDIFPMNTSQLTQAQQSTPSKGSHVPGTSPRLFRRAMAYVDTLQVAGMLWYLNKLKGAICV